VFWLYSKTRGVRRIQGVASCEYSIEEVMLKSMEVAQGFKSGAKQPL